MNASPSGSVVWVQSTVIESSASVPVFCSKVVISSGGKFCGALVLKDTKDE